jgi:hypothetical protein
VSALAITIVCVVGAWIVLLPIALLIKIAFRKDGRP